MAQWYQAFYAVIPPGLHRCRTSKKIMYKTKPQAEHVLTWLKAHPTEEISDYYLNTYKCHTCYRWHIGRKKKKQLDRLLDEIRVLSRAG